MQDSDDISLLRAYVDQGSEEAFATLVTRHVNKVYSVAFRRTRNPHQAAEITQIVFVILARKARSLSDRVILSGWIYQTARLAAVTFIRSEVRRSRREQEAHMQNLPNENQSDIWPQIAPLLEAAMSALNETDQHAIVLRFFDGKSMKEIGAALGASEDAAKMRVNRAVDKLRLFFTKRGIVVPAAVLTAAISANSVQAAPTVLASTATAAALAHGATTSISTLPLVKTGLRLMAWTKAKTAIITAAGCLLAMAATTVAIKEIRSHSFQVWQRLLDTSILDRAPRQVAILPAPRSRPKNIKGWNEYHGMLLGLNQPVTEILFAAYSANDAPISRVRMIFSTPLPTESFDFISNVPNDQRTALQQEISRKFGLVGHSEWIDTNVLVLTVRTPGANGLKSAVDAPVQLANSGHSITFSNMPISTLRTLIENNLLNASNRPAPPVLDQTGLGGYFDLTWDYKRESIAQAVENKLGLQLVPGVGRVEFLVVDKVD